MVLTETPICDFGVAAPDFLLPGVGGRDWSLQQCRGTNGLLVMFICNHCPYVKSIIDRIVRDCRELQQHGINSVAIMANDTHEYTEDSFDNMIAISRRLDFPFPYLLDETQQVARAYGAVCTPDFFGYNATLELQYRGRLDASRKQPRADARRELFEAMLAIASTSQGPREQVPGMGCSIKWKTE